MGRVNYPMTLAQLASEAIKAMKKYGGDKYVLLSDDEEGNGFHECYFSFTDGEQFNAPSINKPRDLDMKDCVILG